MVCFIGRATDQIMTAPAGRRNTNRRTAYCQAIHIKSRRARQAHGLDPNILEQISKALAWADSDPAATANNGPAQGATAGVAAYVDNPRNFPPPTRERADNSVRRQQQQQQAGILISNEIHRRLDGSDPRKAADRERIREENRERKKKWRESNQDRSESWWRHRAAYWCI